MSYTVCDGEVPDVQIVGTSFGTRNDANSSGTLDCGICALNLNELSIPQRQAHYEQHLQDDPQGPSSRIRRCPPSSRPLSLKLVGTKGSRQTKILKNHDDVFWYCTLPAPPPSNYTPGIIPLLKKALWTSHAQGNTQRATLCYKQSVHVGPRATWDRAWACGYRNFLIVCTALMDQTFQPAYLRLLNEPIPPGIRNLQVWIEDAWKAGFDKDGAKQLENLVDTKKWIGTADLWAAFTYRGIPAELVDFDLKNQTRGADVIVDWIVDYFTPKLNTIRSNNVYDALRGASPIVVTDRMPLILQHAGHSRTIVGYEMAKNKKVTLLVFDPSMVLGKDVRSTAISAWSVASLGEGYDASRGHPGSPPLTIHPGSKCPQSTSENMIHLDGDDEILVDGPQDPQLQRAGKPPAGDVGMSKASSRLLLDKFRMDTKKLRKKQYQILYFPMTAPLTEKQRMSQKTVSSTQFC